jgi:quercetin dioxygenase-like cupin family protein
MPTTPRLVVTGHDARGVSVIASDGSVPGTSAVPGGTLFYPLWATGATPAPIDAAAANPRADPLSVPPPAQGTKVLINEMPPGAASPMHRTQTVDYAIVLDGEVVLVLEDSETVLRPGDVVVQRGTNHRWENRSAGPARVAFVLIDGAFTPELRAALGEDALGAVLGARKYRAP